MELVPIQINSYKVKGDSVRVIVSATGKPLDLPIQYVENWHGHVYVPAWLYKKISPYIVPRRGHPAREWTVHAQPVPAGEEVTSCS